MTSTVTCKSIQSMKFIPLALLILSNFSIAFGQQSSQRTCRIVFPDRPADAPVTLHLFDGTSSQEVSLPHMNLSPVYKLAPGNIHLRLLSGKVIDPKTVSADAPSVEIPETHSDFYLIISSDPDNKIAPVSIKLVSTANEPLKLGQMLWINLTDKTIAGKIGVQALSLNPDSSETVDAPRSEGGDYPILLNYFIKGNETTYSICETVWQYNPSGRALVVISNTIGRKAPRVSSFSDFRQEQ